MPVPYWQPNATFSVDESTWTARWERNGYKDDPSNPEKKSHRIVDVDEKITVEKALLQEKQKLLKLVELRKNKPPMNFD